MPAKKKFPPDTHKRINRPSAEDLAILEKAIYHAFKMTFVSDENASTAIYFEGKPVKPREGEQVELSEFFNRIVKTYSTL